MSYKIKLLPEAFFDIKEIVEWHNKEKPGLDRLFYEALKIKINIVTIYPLHYRINYGDVKNIGRSVPYQIHYRVDQLEKSVLVFAITHTNRNPQLWKNKS